MGVVAALALSAPALAQYREYYVHGRVVDTQKQPIPDVEIQLRDKETSRSYGMKTGKDGTFKFAGLPHGVYQATFSKEGYPLTKVEWKFEAPQESMRREDIPDIVLASLEQRQKVELAKAAESGSKEATEKIRKGDYDGAIAQLRGLLEKKPKDVNLLFFLGLAYVGKQMYREALDALTQVTELNPAYPGAHFEMGVSYRQLRDMPKALAAFEMSLEIDPKNADAAYNAGLVLFEQNRIEEALARFEQGLASKPRDPDLLEMAGRCYIHEAKLDRALECLEKARAATTDAAKAALLDELIARLKTRVGATP
ncbi:MAG TPA: tetratricopeptide repeat protein [Vicinamibacteria bacterium]|nr:tetratricopeptide repeat protein [Vicinamibacteria bacterium]